MSRKPTSPSWKLGPREYAARSRIPPRDWKYWSTVALTLSWFVVSTYFLVKSASTPSINQMWKMYDDLERAGKNAPFPPAGQTADPKASPLPVPYSKEGDYYKLNFDILAGFPAGTPDFANPRIDPRLRAKMTRVDVPSSIGKLNGQKVSVVGFMIPMSMNEDKVISFILAQSRMTCCYGVVPKLNQWIYVTMAPGQTAFQMMDIPVTVFGTLGVGTRFNSQNIGWCLYRMVSDKVDVPKRSWF